MTDTDIVAELRAWRGEFARGHNYDLVAMVETFRRSGVTAGRQVVRGVPRLPVSIPRTPPDMDLKPTGQSEPAA